MDVPFFLLPNSLLGEEPVRSLPPPPFPSAGLRLTEGRRKKGRKKMGKRERRRRRRERGDVFAPFWFLGRHETKFLARLEI